MSVDAMKLTPNEREQARMIWEHMKSVEPSDFLGAPEKVSAALLTIENAPENVRAAIHAEATRVFADHSGELQAVSNPFLLDTSL